MRYAIRWFKCKLKPPNNANPYQGGVMTESHGKYPVIFEPLQNVQTSRSTYKVTSFIDFTPYLEYFQQFERYLEAFKSSINDFENTTSTTRIPRTNCTGNT